MAKKGKFYVVWKGKKPGIFDSWKECKKSIANYAGAEYKSFESFDVAKKAYNGNYADFKGKKKTAPSLSKEELKRIGLPNYHSISVDAASSGNPGVMEYQGVDTKTGKKLFKQGPFPQGTNNIGEFLALVHGLAFLKERNSDRIIYTDSRTAMSWVRKKKCNTKLTVSAKNKNLFELVDRAVEWLKKNQYSTVIVKWETKAWGEIPADFGRK
ncbi:ribonuclease H family protein [Maribacter sp. BPC-D8]|uniref:ribonuclease H family protein n=1 Tax=Maribacter sp. BPC-D8 TaxID=3053613 RepID=UPI002B4A50E2|nr:ribonuclease H family protein [Maribacter sp. BPC-D8]WRI28914.1 ribonuclease H family protein [Maribacter sp. BPC-D8]